MKAIETKYRGHRFRSRTEARWGVFFDALGVRWEYEKEGFELPSGRYLPDFWLPASDHQQRVYPGAGHWVEIKGQEPSVRELDLLMELCGTTRHHGAMLSGAIGPFTIGMHKAIVCRDLRMLDNWASNPCAVRINTPRQCRHSEGGAFHPDDCPVVLCRFGCDDFWQVPPIADICWTPEGECVVNRIPAALTAARSARFEHGETPRPAPPQVPW